ncbi:hypothetical protein ETA_00730 [Erwinia tasmaniensis Et1/99]|uniref:Uncharacterized protein n=1 Tax=Erwinia tasmaniensis (strain DSM 17950 / CFBP 7177 / CIP 109463 / NCPPB 4357 / Et1/99) TaxID=465817 RepID=B2VF74_ERWT9|nr:hypothetical protein ETA_00730 [Erwinia tasmaniensis Et1/99]
MPAVPGGLKCSSFLTTHPYALKAPLARLAQRVSVFMLPVVTAQITKLHTKSKKTFLTAGHPERKYWCDKQGESDAIR